MSTLIKLTTTINFTFMMLVNVLPTAAIPLQTNTFTYIGQPIQVNQRYQNLGGYRLYQPIARRFLKSDSDGPFEGQNLNNGYQYAAGNPCHFIDRDGHEVSTLLAEFDSGPFQARQIATFNDDLIIDFIQGQYGFQLLRTYKRGFITSETVHTPNRELIAVDAYEGNYLIRMRADANGDFYQRERLARD